MRDTIPSTATTSVRPRWRTLVVVALTVGIVVVTGCNPGRVGGRCRSGYARSATHVLACRRGRLVPVMTIADYLRLVAPRPAAPATVPPHGEVPTAPPVAPLVTAPPATPAPHGPVVANFSVGRPSGSAPLTTTVSWRIGNHDGRAQICRLDLDGNGAYEMTIDPCPDSDQRPVTFATAGVTTASLRVDDGASPGVVATTTATVSGPSADRYAFQFRFGPGLTQRQQAVIAAAGERWQRVVRTGQPDIGAGVPANLNGCTNAAYTGVVDDLLVDVSVESIDGPGGILGGAILCGLRTSNRMPAFATMALDVDDVELISDARLGSLATHELGHALGIGDWPTTPSLAAGAGTADPRFVGPVAVGAWHALGGTGDVPLENTGGPGTQDAHWRESVFDTELMTGWLDGTAQPLSTVTVGALADLGYGVDLAGADRFTLPAAGVRADSRTAPELEVPRLAPGGPLTTTL